jgi:hypothetical protein
MKVCAVSFVLINVQTGPRSFILHVPSKHFFLKTFFSDIQKFKMQSERAPCMWSTTPSFTAEGKIASLATHSRAALDVIDYVRRTTAFEERVRAGCP